MRFRGKLIAVLLLHAFLLNLPVLTAGPSEFGQEELPPIVRLQGAKDAFNAVKFSISNDILDSGLGTVLWGVVALGVLKNVERLEVALGLLVGWSAAGVLCMLGASYFGRSQFKESKRLGDVYLDEFFEAFESTVAELYALFEELPSAVVEEIRGAKVIDGIESFSVLENLSILSKALQGKTAAYQFRLFLQTEPGAKWLARFEGIQHDLEKLGEHYKHLLRVVVGESPSRDVTQNWNYTQERIWERSSRLLDLPRCAKEVLLVAANELLAAHGAFKLAP